MTLSASRCRRLLAGFSMNPVWDSSRGLTTWWVLLARRCAAHEQIRRNRLHLRFRLRCRSLHRERAQEAAGRFATALAERCHQIGNQPVPGSAVARAPAASTHPTSYRERQSSSAIIWRHVGDRLCGQDLLFAGLQETTTRQNPRTRCVHSNAGDCGRRFHRVCVRGVQTTARALV